MSSSDTSDVEMKPRKRTNTKTKKKNSLDGQYRPSMEQEVPPKPKQFGQPKRPLSAYFLYANDVREDVKSNNPATKMTEISKLVAKQWKEADDDTKEPYLEEAKKAKKDYAAKRKEYVESSKYKKWKKDVAEWNDRYKEEWMEQQFEKKQKREENKKKRAARKAKKEKNGDKDEDKENAKKGKGKKKASNKKAGNKRRGRPKKK